jgi:predicted extracellular nuclease
MAAKSPTPASGTFNADEPSVLDYNTESKSTGQVASLYAADEYRSSDHDPVIVEVELGGERIYLPVVMRGYALP